MLLVAGRVWGHDIETTEPKSVPLRDLESATLQETQIVKSGKCWLFVKLAFLHLFFTSSTAKKKLSCLLHQVNI